MRHDMLFDIDYSSDPQGTLTRVGDLLEVDRLHFRVRWANGAEESVRMGRDHRTKRQCLPGVSGGLKHVVWEQPDLIGELAERDPERLFRLALRDSPHPVNGANLILAVTAAGLPEVKAKAAWRAAKDKLKSSGSVRVDGTGAKATLWLTDDAVAERVDPPPRLANPTRAGSSSGGPFSQPAEAAPEKQPPLRGAHRPHVIVEEAPEGPVVDRHEAVALLMDFLKSPTNVPDDVTTLITRGDTTIGLVAAVLLGETPQSGPALSAPLTTGADLATLPSKVQTAFLEALPDPAKVLVAALPRATPHLDGTDFAQVSGVEIVVGLVQAAGTEFGAALGSSRQASLRTAFIQLCRRISTGVTPGSTGALQLLLLTATLVRQFDLPESVGGQALESLALAIHRSSADTMSRFTTIELAGAMRLAATLPLTEGGLRQKLLEALGSTRPDLLRDDRWWSGVAFDDLASALSGPLERGIRRAGREKSILHNPTLAQLDAADTRQRLFQVLAAPRAMVEGLPPERVNFALARVAQSDTVAASWASALGREAEVAGLRFAVGESAEQLQEATRSAERAVTERDGFRARVLLLEEDLARAAERTSDLRDSQQRQIRIDSLRALATTAIYAETSVRRYGLDATTVLPRLGTLAERQGLKRFGEPGEEATYEPKLHRAVGPAPEVGTVVRVAQPGYLWAVEDIVLERSLVQPI